MISRLFNPKLVARVAGQPVMFRDGEGLRTTFTVSKTITSTPDTCRLSVWNMSPERTNLAAELVDVAALVPGTSQKLHLQIGYDETVATLFNGDIRTVSTQRSGADTVMSAVADDGGDAYTNVPINLSSAGLTPANMVDIAITAMGIVAHPSVAAVLASSDPSMVSPYTAVVIGKASDLLDEVARRIGCRWWLSDGQLFFARRGQAAMAAAMAAVIRPDMLMSEIQREGSDLVRFVSMLDPAITPGGQVVLGGGTMDRSATTVKYYRVEAATYQGDTLGGGPWSVQVVGRSLA